MSIQSFGDVYKEIKSSIVPNNSSFFICPNDQYFDKNCEHDNIYMNEQVFGILGIAKKLDVGGNLLSDIMKQKFSLGRTEL